MLTIIITNGGQLLRFAWILLICCCTYIHIIYSLLFSTYIEKYSARFYLCLLCIAFLCPYTRKESQPLLIEYTLPSCVKIQVPRLVSYIWSSQAK